MKKLVFRIRRVYYDQIVAGTKEVELRRFSDFWRVRVRNIIDDNFEKEYVEGRGPKVTRFIGHVVGVFICGKDRHDRWVKAIGIGRPEEFYTHRSLSDQGKADAGTDKCFAFYLGDEYKEN